MALIRPYDNVYAPACVRRAVKKQKDGRFCQFEFYPGSSSLLVTPAAV